MKKQDVKQMKTMRKILHIAGAVALSALYTNIVRENKACWKINFFGIMISYMKMICGGASFVTQKEVEEILRQNLLIIERMIKQINRIEPNCCLETCPEAKKRNEKFWLEESIVKILDRTN